MKRQGLDSLNSWLITAGLLVVTAVVYGVVRMSAVLFVASMHHFEVDRKKASLPFLLTDFIQAISSPLTGYLASKFGVRLVMSLGCFISGIGIAACFFARNIESVTIFWGIIFGVGYGLSVPLLPLTVTQHFLQKRATALGVMFIGVYVGYSVFPNIVEPMIDKYDLSGSFLLIGGVMFNCIPITLLLRKPQLSTNEKEHKENESMGESHIIRNGNIKEGDISVSDITSYGSCNGAVSKGAINYGYDSENYFETECLHLKEGIGYKHVSKCQTNEKYSDVQSSEVLRKTIGNGNEPENNIENSQSNEEACSQLEKSLNIANNTNFLNCLGRYDILFCSSVENTKNTNHFENGELHNRPTVASGVFKGNSSVIEEPSLYEQNNEKQAPSKSSKLRAFKVFLEPIYLVVLISEAAFEGSFIAFTTVLLDFSLDMGITLSDTKFVILVFSVASIVGLVSFGWVTDDGYLSLTNFTGILLVLRCATSAFIPFANSLPVLLTAVALYGLCEAPLSNLLTLIIPEYYAPEVHEVAISCRLFLCAPVYLLTPTLIGYFRDDLGSYLYLFILMSGSSFACGVLFFLVPQLSKCRCGRDETILRKRSLA